MKNRIHEGDYILWIVKAEPGDNSLDLTFRLMSGHRDVLGSLIKKSFPTHGTATWMLRMMLEACGKKVPHAVVTLNLDKLIGLECAGTITDDGMGKMEICSFFPIKAMEKRIADAFREIALGPEMPRYVM